MLYLIGIGLNPTQLTLEALEAIRECPTVFLENYTSRFAEGNKKELEAIVQKPIRELGRKKIEEEFGTVLGQAKRESVALLVHGNPLIATTHIQILLDAKKQNISVKMIPGISILDLLGKTGLDSYKFGRISTIVFQEENYAPESFFDIIEKNFKNGFHSLCLLDIRSEEERLMSVQEAIGILEKIAKKKGSDLLQKCVLAGLYGMGSKKEKIAVGNAKKLQNSGYNAWPQSLVVCGKLNEKEKEALKELHGAEV